MQIPKKAKTEAPAPQVYAQLNSSYGSAKVNKDLAIIGTVKEEEAAGKAEATAAGRPQALLPFYCCSKAN
jgi:hypothetical protein